MWLRDPEEIRAGAKGQRVLGSGDSSCEEGCESCGVVLKVVFEGIRDRIRAMKVTGMGRSWG